MDAAAHWIRAGLPLRCLKIVMYEGITQDVRRMFEALKAKLMAQNEKLKVRFSIIELFALCKGGNFNSLIWAWFDYFTC